MPRKTFALAVIDSGGANIGSVCYALERLGVTPELVSDPRRLVLAERAILPGVGAAKPAMASKPVASAGGYKVDAVHSGVVYRITHMGVSNFWGTFNKIDGSFAFDPADLSSASFDITIDADSIDSNNAQRDGHLKSPDFFNT